MSLCPAEVRVDLSTPASIQKKLSADGKEIELYCHSKGREEKEVAMVKRFCDKFEAGNGVVAGNASIQLCADFSIDLFTNS